MTASVMPLASAHATWRPDNAAPAARSSAAAAALDPLLVGLDGLAHGVAIFDAQGGLRYANASARTLLSRLGLRGTGAGAGAGASATASEPARRWAEALNRVCQRGLRELVEVPCASTHAYGALVPVSAGGERLAFVTFARDDLCGPVELQMFAARYKLTLAESRVLRQLCHGHKADAIARLHGVSKSTVLTQIAAIRSKTLFRSVRELLDTLSRMPPMNPALAVCN